MGSLHHPASGTSFGFEPTLGGALGRKVQNITAREDLLLSRFAGVAFVHTQILRFCSRRLRPGNHDRVQSLSQQFDVVPIGPGHDKRERGATTVHEQAALGPFFFPDP